MNPKNRLSHLPIPNGKRLRTELGNFPLGDSKKPKTNGKRKTNT